MFQATKRARDISKKVLGKQFCFHDSWEGLLDQQGSHSCCSPGTGPLCAVAGPDTQPPKPGQELLALLGDQLVK